MEKSQVMSLDFSLIDAKRKWNEIFKMLKKNKC